MEDLGGVLGVEVAGRLVGQQQRGAVDQGPGDGSPLHLPAAELMGKMVRPVRHPDLLQYGQGRLADPSGGITAQEEGHLYVLGDGHRGEEVEELEDDPEPGAPVKGQLPVPGGLQMDAVDDDLSRGGMVETAQKVKQRALAGAARAGDGDEFPPGDFQRELVQGRDRRLAVGAGGFDEADHAVHK